MLKLLHVGLRGIAVDVSYYYQILETGILHEKGISGGTRWKFGERKRLREEVLFWQSLLEFILNEENGTDCSETLFDSLKRLCKKYRLPNYERILAKKEQLQNDNRTFEREKEEENRIYSLLKRLMQDMRYHLEVSKDKEMVCRILRVLHNLPKSLHGRSILNEDCRPISCKDALHYAQMNMDEEMKEEYAKYFD